MWLQQHIANLRDTQHLRKTEENLEGEVYSHLVLSCSSQHWRRTSDNGVPENPDVLWLHTIIFAASLQTVYWPVAPLETWGNADEKNKTQGTIQHNDNSKMFKIQI